MTHEQMVAWLILEGWEYTGRDKGTRLEHIIRDKQAKTDGWYGDCVVIDEDNVRAYIGVDGAVSYLDCCYNGFSNAPEQSVEKFYLKLTGDSK